jgi:hypothetical protein
VGDVIDPSRLQQPSFKSGTASSQQVKPSGAQSTEINADVSPGMSGGPTVDNNTAEVLGINSYGLHGESQAFNFITDAPTLRTFLQKNGVHLAELPAPAAKSSPWGIILAVVGVVVLAALILVYVLLQRKKRGPQQPQFAGVGSTAYPQQGQGSPSSPQAYPQQPSTTPQPAQPGRASPPTNPQPPQAAPQQPQGGPQPPPHKEYTAPTATNPPLTGNGSPANPTRPV